jgi:hypothetical protein
MRLCELKLSLLFFIQLPSSATFLFFLIGNLVEEDRCEKNNLRMLAVRNPRPFSSTTVFFLQSMFSVVYCPLLFVCLLARDKGLYSALISTTITLTLDATHTIHNETVGREDGM